MLQRGVESAAVVDLGQRVALHFLARRHEVLAQTREAAVELLELRLVLAFLLRERVAHVTNRLRERSLDLG